MELTTTTIVATVTLALFAFGGVATAIVSVPNRYMHTPNQLVDVSDVEGAAELIATYLAGLAPEQSFIPD